MVYSIYKVYDTKAQKKFKKIKNRGRGQDAKRPNYKFGIGVIIDIIML